MASYFYLISSLPELNPSLSTESLEAIHNQIFDNAVENDLPRIRFICERLDHLNLLYLLFRRVLKTNAPEYRGATGIEDSIIQKVFTGTPDLPDYMSSWGESVAKNQELPFEDHFQLLRLEYLTQGSAILPPEFQEIISIEEFLRLQVSAYHLAASPTHIAMNPFFGNEKLLSKGQMPSKQSAKEYPGIVELWSSLEEGRLFDQDLCFQKVVENRAQQLAVSAPYSSLHLLYLTLRWTHVYRNAEINQEPEKVHLKQQLERLLPNHNLHF